VNLQNRRKRKGIALVNSVAVAMVCESEILDSPYITINSYKSRHHRTNFNSHLVSSVTPPFKPISIDRRSGQCQIKSLYPVGLTI
jgi:hypothetical protein